MTEQDDARRVLERELALEDARRASEAGKKPGITFEGAVRATVRTAAKAALKGGGAVVSGVIHGISDVHGDLSGNPSAEGSAPTIDITPSVVPKGNWFERKKAEMDATVSDLANTRVPLRWRAMWFVARRGLTYWQWSGRTYPHVLYPVSYVAHKMCDRLDHKISEQGHFTDWQKLKRRLLSIGPTTGLMARSRYRAINTASAFVAGSLAITGGIDALYSYATYDKYEKVTISNIFRSPDRNNHVNEVHGYQKGLNGERHPVFFNVGWNPFYLIFFPQYIVSDMSDGDVCDIRTWGSTRRIPVSFRRLFSVNPNIISADCHSPDEKHSELSRPYKRDYYKNTRIAFLQPRAG
jgi:hypothetical protein